MTDKTTCRYCGQPSTRITGLDGDVVGICDSDECWFKLEEESIRVLGRDWTPDLQRKTTEDVLGDRPDQTRQVRLTPLGRDMVEAIRDQEGDET